MLPVNAATKDDNKKKPSIYNPYDFTKCGAEIIEHFNDYYTVRSHTNRWDLVVFFIFILDTICVNSKTLDGIKKDLEIENRTNLI